MTQLSVNLNKIALIRNSRPLGEPKITEFAELSMQNGAHGVTIHPRPDQRHATYQDAFDLRQLIDDRFPQCELNIEGYPDDAWMETVLASKPEQATLVPDDPNQATSDHGWDLAGNNAELECVVTNLRQAGIRVSLFLDPVLEQVDRAKALGADRIELFTAPYASAFSEQHIQQQLRLYAAASQHAHNIGLQVNAGHDLSLKNIRAFCQRVRVEEVSIGHALTCEALHQGFAETIKQYVEILGENK